MLAALVTRKYPTAEKELADWCMQLTAWHDQHRLL
jgi:hypothetical protein